MSFCKLILTAVFLVAAFLPQPLLAAPDGESLFESKCATCHRVGGEGSIGLPLNKNKFTYITDDYLRKTIRLGRPGRIMPAFTALSDAQLAAIISYLRQWSKTPSKADNDAKVSGDADKGKKIFAGNCSSCHGEAGQGLGKGTGQSYSRERDFKVIPPAISNQGFLASVSDHMLKVIISEGIRGTAMPAYKKMGMSEQDINDVIVYLRSMTTNSEVETASQDAGQISPQPTLIVDSPYDFETTVKNLKQALKGYNFRVFPDRYLEQGMFPEWEVNKKQLTVRYCNFKDLYDMVKIDPRVGIGLPCRITVAENSKGKVQLIAMNMRLIAVLFNNRQLEGYAKEMSERQLEIMDEVTL